MNEIGISLPHSCSFWFSPSCAVLSTHVFNAARHNDYAAIIGFTTDFSNSSDVTPFTSGQQQLLSDWPLYTHETLVYLELPTKQSRAWLELVNMNTGIKKHTMEQVFISNNEVNSWMSKIHIGRLRYWWLCSNDGWTDSIAYLIIHCVALLDVYLIHAFFVTI